MIQPEFKDFQRLSRKGNLIAMSKTIPADLETPVSSFLKIAGKEPNAYLLESAEQEEKIGRYSIIGIKPSAILTAQKGRIFISQNGKTRPIFTGEDLIGVIEKSLNALRLVNPEAVPGFCGGFIGYLSYEQVENFESIKLRRKKKLNIPPGIFFLSEDFVIFDHFRKTLTLVVIVEIKNRRLLRRLYGQAVKKIETYHRMLQRPLSLPVSHRHSRRFVPKPNMSQSVFETKVKKIKNYIKAGDCIQVVLSQRLTLPKISSDFQIYRALRSINPSPYMFYFRCGNLRLVGSSPELLVKNRGRASEVRPIAGTRPRGLTPSQDLGFEESLKKSPKEMAEHLMLVDLGRNDLGRVCEFKSVQVKNFARVERYSHVMHLVSDVVGSLKRGKNCFDLLKATFPAGTVTGAPKVRAMQIIDELENEERGPYAGCLGFFSFNRDMEMCITIRTLVIDSKHIYLQAGAGIVKDSNPTREYHETLNKAKALLAAIEEAGNF